MTETKSRLVLHIVGAAEPLHIALDRAEADALERQLPALLGVGEAKTLATADGGRFTVNFAHVATAHIEASRSDTHAYGAPTRTTGFST
jgi:hypothetical protein